MWVIQKIELNSRTFEYVEYDSENLALHIKFNNGTDKKLFCVPESIYEGLIHANSKYNYYYEHIRNKYPEST